VSAHAGVSDDLVFCSKLGNPKERIACYDAAARIAARPTPTTTPARSNILATQEAADHPIAPATAPTRNSSFDGAFFSIGGGYGVANPRTVNLTSAGFGASDQVTARIGPAARPLAITRCLVTSFSE
jgi:hypothetical protein